MKKRRRIISCFFPELNPDGCPALPFTTTLSLCCPMEFFAVQVNVPGLFGLRSLMMETLGSWQEGPLLMPQRGIIYQDFVWLVFSWPDCALSANPLALSLSSRPQQMLDEKTFWKREYLINISTLHCTCRPGSISVPYPHQPPRLWRQWRREQTAPPPMVGWT